MLKEWDQDVVCEGNGLLKVDERGMNVINLVVKRVGVLNVVEVQDAQFQAECKICADAMIPPSYPF